MLNSFFDKWYYSLPEKERRYSPDLTWLQKAFNGGIHFAETNGRCDLDMEETIKYCECGLPEPKCVLLIKITENGLNPKDECKYFKR